MTLTTLRLPLRPSASYNEPILTLPNESPMLYQNVCLEAIAYTLPEEVVTSAEIEARLEPLYTRLRLPEGRLELMTGIRQRRFWPPDMPPSEKSVETAEKAHPHRRASTGNTSARWCTARSAAISWSRPPPAACIIASDLPESLRRLRRVERLPRAAQRRGAGGQHDRAGADSRRRGGGHRERPGAGRIDDRTPQRRHVAFAQDIKTAFASLTIGSGSAAIVLCDRELSRTGNRLLGGVMQTATEHCELCQGGHGNLPSPWDRGRECRA